jgi:hypothetical protein
VPNRSLTVEQVLTLLAQTPPCIATLSAGLAPAQLQGAPAPGEWSANEVLAHLQSGRGDPDVILSPATDYSCRTSLTV